MERYEFKPRHLLLWLAALLSLGLFIVVSRATENGGDALHPWEYVAGTGGTQYAWENHPLKCLYFGFDNLFSVFRFVDNNERVMDMAPEDAMRMHPMAYTLVKNQDLLFIICFGLFGMADTIVSMLLGLLGKFCTEDDDDTEGIAALLGEHPAVTIAAYCIGNVTAWVGAFLGFKLTLVLAPLLPEAGVGRFLFLLAVLFIFGLPFVRSIFRCKLYMLLLGLVAGIPLLSWILIIAVIVLLEFVVLKATEGASEYGLLMLLFIEPIQMKLLAMGGIMFGVALIITLLLTV
ncbi:MAG: hypothetical protein K5695_03390 [Oscillospiraceae bacterium]|nr:hypothetical protein [Oscillospiraceae bacterium]